VPDEKSRVLAQSEFDRPIAVEAGAGTGKTTVLVSRVLAWVLARGWDAVAAAAKEGGVDGGDGSLDSDRIAADVMSGVVAITFTDAAAAQMATRISRSLATLSSAPEAGIVGFEPSLLENRPDPDALAGRALALVGALDRLKVRTIHSYCLNLLVRNAITARVSPDLRVDAEGRRVEEVTRRAVEEQARRAFARPRDHAIGRLALRQIGIDRLAEMVVTLVAEDVPAEALEQDPFSVEACRRFQSRLSQRLETLSSLSAPFAAASRAKNATRILQSIGTSLARLEDLPDRPDRTSLTSLTADFDAIWDENLLRHLHKWSRHDFNKAETEAIGAQGPRLAAAADSAHRVLRLAGSIDVDLCDDARRALAPLLRQIGSDLRRSGVTTYNALLTEAWRLVTEHAAVCRQERSRIDQLLVDEFQDTDRVQCALVRALGLGKDRQNAPGLFVVGDPKQSIYGWRNADLGAYDEFKKELEAAGGLICHLEQNFRSHAQILEEVDRSIAPIMIRQPGLQPQFRSLQPDPDNPATPRFPTVEYWISWRTDPTDGIPNRSETRADEVAQIEAEAIASDIRRLHRESDTAWSKFALLLRSSGRLETYLEAFRRYEVPFVVSSDKHYFRRREIIDAAALVRTIVNPVDHLALLTFLRSPSVGLPDAALLPLWRRQFPSLVTAVEDPHDATLDKLREIVFEVAASLPKDIPGIERIRGWEVSVVAALGDLAVLRAAARREPADRFIELLRHRFLPEATEAARYLGSYRVANLDSFFRRLERLLEEQSGDIQGVLRLLRRSVAEVEEAEQALPEGATESGVQVMTIHKSKGLEFEHVYVAQLHAHGGSSPDSSLRFDRRWLPGETPQYSLFGAPTLDFDEVLDRDAQIDDAERVRTLYVAMTRAKCRLVMVGKWPSTPDRSGVGTRGTYIDLLMDRVELPESFDGLLDECLATGDPAVDRGAVRWRFPALERTRAPRPEGDSGGSDRNRRAELRGQAEQLRSARLEAVDRMNRPLSTSASGEAEVGLASLLEKSGRPPSAPHAAASSRLVGTAFHQVMETWDLHAEPLGELQRQRQIQIERLKQRSLPAQRDLVLHNFEELLDRFVDSEIWQRFVASRDRVLGRELPVVVHPRHSSLSATGFVSGSIDLVLQDPAGEGLIVVDYKTDRIEQEDELQQRAEAYHRQESLYATALKESLGLDSEPACQLWFIWPDRLWQDESSGGA